MKIEIIGPENTPSTPEERSTFFGRVLRICIALLPIFILVVIYGVAASAHNTKSPLEILGSIWHIMGVVIAFSFWIAYDVIRSGHVALLWFALIIAVAHTIGTTAFYSYDVPVQVLVVDVAAILYLTILLLRRKAAAGTISSEETVVRRSAPPSDFRAEQPGFAVMFVTCPHCGEELALDRWEQAKPTYVCPDCERTVEL